MRWANYVDTNIDYEIVIKLQTKLTEKKLESEFNHKWFELLPNDKQKELKNILNEMKKYNCLNQIIDNL